MLSVHSDLQLRVTEWLDESVVYSRGVAGWWILLNMHHGSLDTRMLSGCELH